MHRCPVCYDIFRPGEVAIICPNLHGICHECFPEVVQKRRTRNKCPMCRARLWTPRNCLFPQTWPSVVSTADIPRFPLHEPDYFGGLRVARTHKGPYVVVEGRRHYLFFDPTHGWRWRDHDGDPPDPWARRPNRDFRGQRVNYTTRSGYFCEHDGAFCRLRPWGRGWRLRSPVLV